MFRSLLRSCFLPPFSPTLILTILQVHDPKLWGITPNCVNQIFDHVELCQKNQDDNDYTLSLSFLEVYNEQVRDLLQPGDKDNLQVRETASHNFIVPGLTVEHVTSRRQMFELISRVRVSCGGRRGLRLGRGKDCEGWGSCGKACCCKTKRRPIFVVSIKPGHDIIRDHTLDRRGSPREKPVPPCTTINPRAHMPSLPSTLPTASPTLLIPHAPRLSPRN